MVWRLVVVVLGILVIAAGASLVLFLTLDRDEYMRQESAAVQQRTVPPDSEFLGHRPVTRSRSSAVTSWEFRTAQGWVDYCNWVKAKMSPEYRFVSGENGKRRVSFRRTIDGDAQHVDVEALTDESPTRVRVTFRSYAY